MGGRVGHLYDGLKWGKQSIHGATYVQEMTEKVCVLRLNMKEARDRHKSCADRTMRELEFEVGDRVYFKMVMLRGPNRSIAENKLSLRFMNLFPVVERVVLVVPVRILERRVKVLRHKKIPLLRFLWDCSDTEDETWEPEAKMKLKFRKWFDKQVVE
ncbi:unnamed protein product [Microthlaspi erraticum]|uniref:Chromo domain-containing protein n=1 Tax=Microthlaspi erraticum TaxID=1685480 RepID=A0A6D2JGN1_9BRAS|nr:unnamed protein product [Microthlaspi erraticum]